MKKLICLASLLCVMHISTIPSSIPSTIKPSIPKEFTILNAQTLPEKSDAKTDCFFYILIAAPTPQKNGTVIKKEGGDKTNLYTLFSGITTTQQGPLIPKDFINPGIPALNSTPTYCLYFGWEDKGGKNASTDAAITFTKSLARLNQNFKKSYNCYYLIVTEGRSGLLINYATHNLKKESFSISVIVELGTPLPDLKANPHFYPDFSSKKIGTVYSLYTQHTYLGNPAHFPPTPQTSYAKTFLDGHKNLYNIRLLLNGNQRSLQNIFEGKDLKKSFVYLGQHIFELCNHSKHGYQQHTNLWANVDTTATNQPLIGIISHPVGEKVNAKNIKKEHQLSGMQLDNFKKKVGSSADTRINMKTGQSLRSNHRPVAHLKKLQKLTCQTA